MDCAVCSRRIEPSQLRVEVTRLMPDGESDHVEWSGYAHVVCIGGPVVGDGVE